MAQIFDIEKDTLLLKTSDGRKPGQCSDYDYNAGTCKSTGNGCDDCYGEFMKNLFKSNYNPA